MRLIIAAVVLLYSILPATGATPDKVVPAINEIELWQQVGQQPYEFTFTQREEHPKTLVDFEELKDWNLELYDGAKGEFRRSREQQLWGQYVAKFLFSGASDKSRMIARPPKPIPIPERFDSVEFWGYANRWGWMRDETTPPVDVSILIQDARGKEFTVSMTDTRWKQWWLIHRKLPAAIAKEIVWPATFTGIEIAKLKNADPRYFFCDSLAFYMEDLKPVPLHRQPKRNLKPFRGQITGLNTGEGTLPFPTREETILPANFEKDFQVTARQAAPNRFELQYKGKDATVTYTYQPKTGSLSELTVAVNAGTPYRPMDGGGVRFTDTAEGQVPQGSVLSATLQDGVVKAKFAIGSRVVDYE
ncbi:MAG TPA: hypothetical protein VLE22_21100, partial [Bryobacteraceae bacterium]|nr:hypothetical protein [Bryobacteraceae bacterium]